MRALFKSINLLGDAMYIQPALEQWASEHEDWEIDLLTLNNYVTDAYLRFGIPNLRVVFEPEGQYDFEFVFDVNTAFKISDEHKVHVSTAYGRMLGYNIQPRRVKFIPSDADDHKKNLVLFSMFSNSCACREEPPKPPNKMIGWNHWYPVVGLVRQLGGEFGLLGAKEEKPGLPFSDDEYYTGISMEKVARLLRDARLFLTIDNGMSHIAASQGTPTILFYPKCLGIHYICPPGNNNLIVYHMDPEQISERDFLLAVSNGIGRLLRKGVKF